MKPDADTIVEDARKLQQERFNKRDASLVRRRRERFNEISDKERNDTIPEAYRQTAYYHESSIIDDEGQAIGTLVHATPIPHITPGVPEDQPLTTKMEKFLMAWWDESEAVFGPVSWMGTLAQIHDNISWEYSGWRKVPYKGQPSPPSSTDLADMVEYGTQNDRFKRDAGVAAYCDRRHVPTGTAYWTGNVYNPTRFWEIKQVPERDLMDTYDLVKSNNSYSKRDQTTTPSGFPEGQNGTETLVKVIEYWDREWCVIVAETTESKWLGMRQVKSGFLLAEWEHKWGRVPYFARPSRITDQLDEDKKFAGPLDPIHTEMPSHKKLRTMAYSVAYQTAFSPQIITTEKDGDTIVDANDKMLEFLKFVPGEARQMAPGQKVGPLGQSPEIGNLYQEVAASQARIEHFSLSPAAKGISPGADTANAAISNLHRAMVSTLDPLAQQASRQASSVFRFVLERIKAMPAGERCFVFDKGTDSYLSLAPEEIVSLNVTAKVTPDQGQFQLLIEKHAAELRQLGLITLQQMYEMWGKENPEEYVLELKAEKLAEGLEPVINQQIISDLGMLDAVNAMIQANAQGSARNAVPGLMGQVNGMNDTGAGKGSGGQPRGEGVRSPVVSTTTQPQLTPGGA